jgi:NAD(P)-dependent dehydrogenase (short-subunit alcohol dehydrogenase family)
MKDKRILITGPTSGVGKEIAMQLAPLGAELILACRDLKKGKAIASEITRRTGSSKLAVMQVDTSSQKSIREFAKEIRRKYRRLDVLINNAASNRGVLPKVASVDGIELTFATNVLGYFMLTQELLPCCRRACRRASSTWPRSMPAISIWMIFNSSAAALKVSKRMPSRRRAIACSAGRWRGD